MSERMTPERLAETRRNAWLGWVAIVQALDAAEAEVDRLQRRAQIAELDLKMVRAYLSGQLQAVEALAAEWESSTMTAATWKKHAAKSIRSALAQPYATGGVVQNTGYAPASPPTPEPGGLE